MEELPCLHDKQYKICNSVSKESVTKFKLQMVYELSKGTLYPLQGGADEKVCAAMIHLILCISDMVMYRSSNSTDSCQNVDGCTSDVR